MGLFCGGAGLAPTFQPQREVIRLFLCFSRVLAACDPPGPHQLGSRGPGWLGSESAALQGEATWEKQLGRKFQKEGRGIKEPRRAGTRSKDLEGTKEKAGISKGRERGRCS